MHRFTSHVRCRRLRIEIAEANPKHHWSITNLDLDVAWRNRVSLPAYLLILTTVFLFFIQLLYLGPSNTKREIIVPGPGLHGSPVFSPNGRFVVFDSDQGSPDRNHLYSYDRVTKSTSLLIADTTPEFKDWHASYGKGGLILFASNRAGPSRTDKMHLFHFNRNTGITTQLTFSDGATEDWPDISPVNQEIVFQSSFTNSPSQIQLAQLDTTKLGASTPLSTAPGGAIHPRFSPDGQKVIFAAKKSASSAWSLWSVSRTSSGWSVPAEIIVLSGNAYHPTYAPDNATVIFVTDLCGAPGLALARPLDEATFTIEWLGYFWDTDPAVSPDNYLIAFSTAREGNWQIAIMPNPASGQRPISFLDCIVMPFTRQIHDWKLSIDGISIYRPNPLSGLP